MSTTNNETSCNMNMEAETEHKSLPSSEQGLPKIEGEETLADGKTNGSTPLETSLQPLGQDSHSNEKQQDKTHEATEPALTIEHSEEADTIAGPDDESTTAILGVPGQKQEQKTDNDTSEMNEVSKETTTSTNNNLNQTPTVPEPKKEQLDNNNSNDVKEGLNSNESNDTPEESGSKESTDAQAPAKLPKWMVEDANAPPSPEPANEDAKEKPEESVPQGEKEKKTGRGRGRRPKAEMQERKTVEASASQSQESSSSLLQRPRRSTRSRIDYSNPDAGTIIAEATDEELGKLSNSKSPRGGGGRGRGRKRKASESDGIEDGDSGSDYGKKKKRNVTLLKSSPSKPSSSKGRRGRPPGKKTGRRNVKSKKYDSDSDNDNEVQYDDASSGMEQEHSDIEKPPPTKKTVIAKNTLPPPKTSSFPGKRRGRPPRSSPKKTAPSSHQHTIKGQNNVEKSKDVAKTSEAVETTAAES